MKEQRKPRRWLLDVALIVIILILGVLIYLQINPPVKAQSDGQDESSLGGYDGSTPQTLTHEETEETEETEAIPAWDFTLQNLDGEMVSLSDFQGKPVLLNFWATTCPPCLIEMPLIQETADRFSEELVVLLVNVGESMEDIRAFAERNDYHLNFLEDTEALVAGDYRVRGIPTSFFIDAEGMIQATYIGMMDEAIMSYYLEKIGVVE
jgi:thiol-disulfide isomerase/thioredoxin